MHPSLPTEPASGAKPLHDLSIPVVASGRIVIVVGDRVDRDAVERILSRAQELSVADDADLDDRRIDVDALADAAAEVGIDPDAVRDAAAIETFTLDPRTPAALDRVAGPPSVVVERTLSVPPHVAIDRIEAWLGDVHRLRCDRRASDRLVAVRRSDVAARVGRKVVGLRGEGGLGTVDRVDVEAVPQSSGRAGSMVRVRVDRQGDRTRRLLGSGARGVASIGAATIGIAEAVIIWPVVAIPCAVTGAVVARSGGRRAVRAELELERLLGAVERGEEPATFRRRLRRSVRPG